MKNQYREMERRHQEEVNAFPMIFAFNQQQLADGLQRLGLAPTDTNLLCCFSNAGGFCKKSDLPRLQEMFQRHRRERHKAITADQTGQGFIYDMFVCELANHEYSYTGDLEDTLNALGITAQQIESSPQLQHGLALACKAVCEKDCFG